MLLLLLGYYTTTGTVLATRAPFDAPIRLSASLASHRKSSPLFAVTRIEKGPKRGAPND